MHIPSQGKVAAIFALGFAAAAASSAFAQTPLTTQLVMGGFTRPVWAGSPPGDMNRIFVVEQHTGMIKIVKKGVLLATPYLDLNGLATGNEQGLLSMAFDPNYEVNGHFYVYLTVTGGTINLRRYTVMGDPLTSDIADPASVVTLFTQTHPTQTNHNGGGMMFGVDGMLYVSIGDGGGANDVPCNAQNELTKLGKLLRVDVNNPPTYVPATNPFVGNPNYDPMIWATGLRNPWRLEIDPTNGDIYIGDVGQDAIEEIDWVPGTSAGGENYGWRVMEGNNCPNTACMGAPACNSPSYTDPIHAYPQLNGACTSVGGIVYRGCGIPDLKGTYFFADYCNGQKWSFKVVGGALTQFQERTAELEPPGTPTINRPVHYGRDACGEILIVDHATTATGEVWKVVPAVAPPGADLGNGKVGSNGLIPNWYACGLLTTGFSAEMHLQDAPANKIAILFVSATSGSTPFMGGTLVPGLPVLFTLSFVTDGDGKLFLGAAPGGGGPFSAYTQWAIADPGATFGVGMSNALRLDFGP